MTRQNEQSGRSPAENVGAQIAPSNLAVSDGLDSRPVLGVEKDAVLQPVRHGLLLEGRPLHHLGQPFCEGGLAATGNSDCSTERGNVRFLHTARQYTSFLVGVNKNASFSNNKETCNVLQMPVPQRKDQKPAPSKKRPKKAPVVGPDGLTFAQRVQRLMTEKDVGQTELARMCSDYFRSFVTGADDVVEQQHIFNIVKGQDSAWCMPLIAAVFDVRELWLQIGIGPRERK